VQTTCGAEIGQRPRGQHDARNSQAHATSPGPRRCWRRRLLRRRPRKLRIPLGTAPRSTQGAEGFVGGAGKRMCALTCLTTCVTAHARPRDLIAKARDVTRRVRRRRRARGECSADSPARALNRPRVGNLETQPEKHKTRCVRCVAAAAAACLRVAQCSLTAA
jgi:hypothetical protein